MYFQVSPIPTPHTLPNKATLPWPGRSVLQYWIVWRFNYTFLLISIQAQNEERWLSEVALIIIILYREATGEYPWNDDYTVLNSIFILNRPIYRDSSSHLYLWWHGLCNDWSFLCNPVIIMILFLTSESSRPTKSLWKVLQWSSFSYNHEALPG